VVVIFRFIYLFKYHSPITLFFELRLIFNRATARSMSSGGVTTLGGSHEAEIQRLHDIYSQQMTQWRAQVGQVCSERDKAAGTIHVQPTQHYRRHIPNFNVLSCALYSIEMTVTTRLHCSTMGCLGRQSVIGRAQFNTTRSIHSLHAQRDHNI
jgi:hypothetical protein